MKKLTESTSQWLANAACLCLIVLMLVTFVDVVGRFFDVPLKFAVEIIQLGMGLLVFFGLAITTLRGGHIAVDLLAGLLPPLARKVLTRVAALSAVLFIALMAWRLWDRALNFMSDGLVTDVLGLPVYPTVLIMALAAGFATLIAIIHLFAPPAQEESKLPSVGGEIS